MPATVYRIARAPYADLSGEGARLSGGRWNRPGRSAVYTSENRALAVLEALVHMQASRLPPDLVILTVEIPDSVPQDYWKLSGMPEAWREVGREAATERGDAWLDRGEAAVLSGCHPCCSWKSGMP